MTELEPDYEKPSQALLLGHLESVQHGLRIFQEEFRETELLLQQRGVDYYPRALGRLEGASEWLIKDMKARLTVLEDALQRL